LVLSAISLQLVGYVKTKTADSGYLLVIHASTVSKIYTRGREKNGTEYAVPVLVYHAGAKRVRHYRGSRARDACRMGLHFSNCCFAKTSQALGFGANGEGEALPKRVRLWGLGLTVRERVDLRRCRYHTDGQSIRSQSQDCGLAMQADVKLQANLCKTPNPKA
jgi:hypothetical protein